MVNLARLNVHVTTGLAMDVVLFLFESLEVANDASVAERLAVAIVSKAEVGHPHILEGIKMLLSDGEDLLVEDPVNDIGARRVCQRALVVVESLGVILKLDLLRWGSALVEGLEELVEADPIDLSEVKGSQLFDKGV